MYGRRGTSPLVEEVVAHPMGRALDGILRILDHARCSVCTRLPLSFGSVSVAAWRDGLVPRLKLLRRDSSDPRRPEEEEEHPQQPKHNLTAQRRREIRAIFDNLDRDHRNRVTFKEVKRYAKELNIPQGCFHEEDFQSIGGGLEYRQFEAMVVRKQKVLQQAFDTVDANHDGYIDMAELSGFLRLLQLQERTRIGHVTWHIGRSGIRKMMYACEMRQEGKSDGKISKRDLMDILIFALDERDVRNITPRYMDAAVQKDYIPSLSGDPNGVPWLQHLLSGGVASAAGKTCVSPLSVIGNKSAYMRMQDASTRVSVAAVAQAVFKDGGPGAFWKGNIANCIEGFPKKGLDYLAYEVYQIAFSQISTLPIAARQFTAGACAGVTSTIATYPINTVAVHLAVAPQPPAQVIRNFANPEGVKNLFKGLIPTIAGAAPFVGVYFGVYEGAKRVWRRHTGSGPDENLGHIGTLLCASVAVTAGSLLTWPIYNVARRMQLQPLVKSGAAASGSSAASRSPAAVALNIIRTEGLQGLYVGIVPGLIKSLPSSSVQMLVYEQLKEVFARARLDEAEKKAEEEDIESLANRLLKLGNSEAPLGHLLL